MRRILLTITAVGMVLSSTLVAFDASGPGASITPPGPFFAIWGLVIALCLAVAATAWWRPNSTLIDAIGWPLIVAQLGFTVWLFMASAGSAAGTVAVFAMILAALLIAMARLRTVPAGPGRDLASAAVGLYAGWSSAAIWLNIVTTLPAPIADRTPVQVAGLVAAGVTAAAVIWFLRPSVTYPGAVAWGLIGIALAAAGDRAWPQMTVVVIDLVIVVALTLASHRATAPRGVL
jgi:hypothetical protein